MGQHNPAGAKGRCFVHALEEGKRSECLLWLTPRKIKLDNFRERYTVRPNGALRKAQIRESTRKKNIGEPYEGEPHVRFDEGELGRPSG